MHMGLGICYLYLRVYRFRVRGSLGQRSGHKFGSGSEDVMLKPSKAAKEGSGRALTHRNRLDIAKNEQPKHHKGTWGEVLGLGFGLLLQTIWNIFR